MILGGKPPGVSCRDGQGLLLAIGGVGEAGKNIIAGEIRKVCQDFFGRHAGGEIGEDIIDSDPHPSNAGFATALSRFQGNDVLVVHGDCWECDRTVF